MTMNRPPSDKEADTEIVSVYIEARPGVSNESLHNAMQAAKVTGIEELTPGILAARMPAANVRALESFAGVEIMQRKFMRTPEK